MSWIFQCYPFVGDFKKSDVPVFFDIQYSTYRYDFEIMHVGLFILIGVGNCALSHYHSMTRTSLNKSALTDYLILDRDRMSWRARHRIML